MQRTQHTMSPYTDNLNTYILLIYSSLANSILHISNVNSNPIAFYNMCLLMNTTLQVLQQLHHHQSILSANQYPIHVPHHTSSRKARSLSNNDSFDPIYTNSSESSSSSPISLSSPLRYRCLSFYFTNVWYWSCSWSWSFCFLCECYLSQCMCVIL